MNAAIATAAHDVLVHYFPAQQAALDTKQVGELNAMLAQEQRETEAAHNALARAIQMAKSK